MSGAYPKPPWQLLEDLVKRVRRMLVPREQSGSVLTIAVSVGMLVLGAAGLIGWQAKAQTPPAESQSVSPYTKWLNANVAYIINDQERMVFRGLRTDEERNRFIEQLAAGAGAVGVLISPRPLQRERLQPAISHTADEFSKLRWCAPAPPSAPNTIFIFSSAPV